LQARREALATALDDRTRAGAALPGMDAKLANLVLQVDVATSAYRTLRTNYESASVTAAQQADEISPIDRAKPPLYPDKPWRWLFALVGMVLGVLAGASLTLYLNLRSGTLRPFDSARGRLVPPPPAVPALASSMLPATVRPPDVEGFNGSSLA